MREGRGGVGGVGCEGVAQTLSQAAYEIFEEIFDCLFVRQIYDCQFVRQIFDRRFVRQIFDCLLVDKMTTVSRLSIWRPCRRPP